jgi:hypothetical protein
MRALDREKTEAVQRRQAEAVESWSSISRVIEALAADERPARNDAELLISGFRRFRDARGDVSFEAALGLIGGSEIHCALRLADRDEILRTAWRQCLPELKRATAARRILKVAAALAGRAHRGLPTAALDELQTYVQRALLIGGGALRGFKQLDRILKDGQMQGTANVHGANVHAARGRREATGEKVCAGQGGSIRGSRDRGCRSGADGNRGPSPAASVAPGHSGTDR